MRVADRCLGVRDHRLTITTSRSDEEEGLQTVGEEEGEEGIITTKTNTHGIRRTSVYGAIGSQTPLLASMEKRVSEP